MTKPILPYLETMVSYACNLSCLGCTNYSDYDTQGYVPWSQGKEWIQNWLERVNIERFGLIGGEPLLNPDLKNWIYGTREIMPDARLMLVTNGVLFNKHTNVLDWLLDIGNCVFKVSTHQPNEFYTQTALQYIFNRVKWEPITEFGIDRWIGPNGVRFQCNIGETFAKSFKGDYTSMMPHNSDPNSAIKNCVQKTCPLLYNGRLYKCSSIALLNKTLADWKQTAPDWDLYRNYAGIGTDCNDAELDLFIKQFGLAEYICRMCPSETDTDSHFYHLNNVQTKIQWIKKNRV